MVVRNIGTAQSQLMWQQLESTQSTSASSNEGEQPITKATRSSRHQRVTSVGLVDQTLAVAPHAVASRYRCGCRGPRQSASTCGSPGARRGWQQTRFPDSRLAKPQEVAGPSAFQQDRGNCPARSRARGPQSARWPRRSGSSAGRRGRSARQGCTLVGGPQATWSFFPVFRRKRKSARRALGRNPPAAHAHLVVGPRPLDQLNKRSGSRFLGANNSAHKGTVRRNLPYDQGRPTHPRRTAAVAAAAPARKSVSFAALPAAGRASSADQARHCLVSERSCRPAVRRPRPQRR